MLKKLFVLLVVFFMLAPNTPATDEDTILGVISIMVNTGMYNAPKWAKAFKQDEIIAIRQLSPAKKEIAGLVTHHKDGVTKMDVTASHDFWSLRNWGYDEYIYQYPGSDAKDKNPIFRYKVSGNTIYKYDRPDTGWYRSILDIFNFEADGDIISFYKISDDGVVTHYDLSGNKLGSFVLIDREHIFEFDSEDQVIDFYNVFTWDEYYSRKKNKQETKQLPKVTVKNSQSNTVIPILVAVARSPKADNYEWTDKINDSSRITIYNAHGDTTGSFSIFGDNITQYDAYGDTTGSFSIFGDNITQYDAHGDTTGSFSIFGDNITQYNAYGDTTGSFSIFGNNITQYDAYGNTTGSFSIFGNNITQYDAHGDTTGSFSIF